MKALLDNLRQSLFFYIEHFGLYDYIMLSLVLGIFFLLVIFSLLIIFKFQFLGSLLFIFSIVFLFCGIFFGYNFVDSSVRTRNLELTNVKQLQYSPTTIVDLRLTNLSKKPFNICKIGIEFYKNNKNFILAIKNFRPIKVHLIDTNETILPNSFVDFNISIENFRPSDFNISTFSRCF